MNLAGDTRDALEILRDAFLDSPRIAELGKKTRARVVLVSAEKENPLTRQGVRDLNKLPEGTILWEKTVEAAQAGELPPPKNPTRIPGENPPIADAVEKKSAPLAPEEKLKELRAPEPPQTTYTESDIQKAAERLVNQYAGYPSLEERQTLINRRVDEMVSMAEKQGTNPALKEALNTEIRARAVDLTTERWNQQDSNLKTPLDAGQSKKASGKEIPRVLAKKNEEQTPSLPPEYQQTLNDVTKSIQAQFDSNASNTITPKREPAPDLKQVAPEPPPPPPAPETTKPPREPVPDLEMPIKLEEVEQQLKESIEKTAGAAPPAEPPPEKPPAAPEEHPEPEPPKKKEPKAESHEDIVKKFDEKTEQLKKEVESGTAPNKEKKLEVLARQTAKDSKHDLAKIDSELAYLNKPENKKGVNLLKITRLELARKLVMEEVGTVPTVPEQKAKAKEEKNEQGKEKESPKKPFTVDKNNDIALEKTEYKEISAADKAFEEFGISANDLSRIKGYENLDANQKEFIFTNLRRVLYSDIESRAEALLVEDTARKGTTRRTGRKLFEGFAGTGGKQAAQEKNVLEQIRTGGIPAHGETIQILVNMTKNNEVTINPETGGQEIAYINTGEFGDKHVETVEQFNKSARLFAAIPEDWAYASKKERAQYESAKRHYEEARRSVFQITCAKLGDFANASEFMQNRDTQISMQRILKTYPQLENVLQTVSRIEGQSSIGSALKSTAKTIGWKASLAGMGSIIRLGSINTLAASATEAAMATGGIINGVREGYRARTKAQEEREAMQHGLTRKEKGTLKSGRNLLGMGEKDRARAAGHAYRKTDFIDASNYAERIDKLLIKINDPEHEKQSLNQRQLHRLVNMAEAHMAGRLVNFGRGSSRLAAAFEFTNKLAEARVELARKNWTDQKNSIPNLTYFDNNGKPHKISLPDFMNKKHIRMSAEERKFITRGVVRGVAVGAVAGGVGAQFAGWVRDAYGDEIQEWIGEVKQKFGFAAAMQPPVGVGKSTSEVIDQANEAMRSANLSAARAEAAASLAETERAAQKAETTIRNAKKFPTSTPPENLPVGKKPSLDVIFPKSKDSITSLPSSIETSEKTITLSVGNRGPEGVIIDEFKNNTELAKQFGWDGKETIDTWAGSKAHTLWLEHANEALKNKDVLEQMKKLGYLKGLSKQDMNDGTILLGRYTEIMHHLKKGSFLSLEPGSKQFNFSKLLFLKAHR